VSRRVNSVGFARDLAGGAVKAVARPERSLLAALVPFDGRVRWSSAVGRLLPSCSRLLGVAVRGLPPPDREWRRIRFSENKVKTKMTVCATTPVILGVGPPGPLPGDFPAAGGRLPIQAISGVAADPARHRLVLDAGVVEVQEGLVCYFLCVLDFSVRSWT
jgi:hypothetical protein